MKLKASTTHCVIRARVEGGKYIVWSQHKDERLATAACAAIGKNGWDGHTLVVPVAALAGYGI